MKRIFVIAAVVILAGVCFGQPTHQVEVVAEVAITNQTGETTGTLYTPAQTGMFRVSFMVQCTTGSPAVEPRLFWKDDHGIEFTSTDVSCGNPHLSSAFIVIIKAIAGQPITWVVFGQAQVYDVYLTLEQIGPKVQ
jgi:hypothetical protein